MQANTNIDESIKNRRSIRKYKPQVVEPEKIEALLTAAFYSPSARNSRAWEFIVVTDKDKITKVGEMKPHSAHAKNASLVIVVCSKEWQYWVEDCSIAAEHILLEATHQGLGGCWIECYDSKTHDMQDGETYIKNIFSVPNDIRVLCCLSIGYPDITIPPHTSTDFLTEKVHSENW